MLGLNKLKALLILGFSSLGAGAISVPSLIVGNRFEEFSFREFNPKPENYSMNSNGVGTQASESNGGNTNNHTQDTSKFTNFPEVKVSDSEIIRGTKKYNNGNYVLYFGSDACPNCTNFLYNAIESPESWVGRHENIYRDGMFYETYSLAQSKEKLKTVKFIFFSDKLPSLDDRNNDDLVDIPWNRWRETLLSQGKVQGDYKRYDKSALKFRKVLSLLQYYFGEKASGIPMVIIYKEGIPFVLHKDKIEELELDKKRTTEAVSSITDSTSNTDIILRYDLFKHLEYIFNRRIIWI